MVFREKLLRYREEVERELERFFDLKKKSFDTSNGIMGETLRMMEDYVTRGGKRIRPAIIMASYKGFSGEDSDEIIKLSVSLEFMHASLLVHDDVIDRSVMRRKGETIHMWIKRWYMENFGAEEPEAEKFGNDMAILVGDIYSGMALEILVDSDMEVEKKNEVLEMYQKTYQVTNIGQILDLWLHRGKDGVSERDNFEIMDRKTVAYTFENPLKIGALLAGVFEEKKEEIENVSRHMGRAYQLKDDLLDIYADEEDLGKKVLTDMKEGKKTIPVVKAIENGSKEQVEQIFSLLGKDSFSEEDIEIVRDIIDYTGALDYCERLIEANIEESKNWIDKLGFEEDIELFFYEMADFIGERGF